MIAHLNVPTPTFAQTPGPELFAQDPKTPMELWDAIDYLVRTGQSKKAVPYLDKFTAAKPSDEVLVQIRDRFGVGSFLRLSDDPATAKYTEPVSSNLAAAARRYVTQPDRISRLIGGLTETKAEQDYAVTALREAGPDAVPVLVKALDRPGITPAERSLLVRGMGRLDRSAVPPLLACLDSGNPQVQTSAITALGQIGDPRAVPFLAHPAAAPGFAPEVRSAAQEAIAHITGQPSSTQPSAAARDIIGAAWQYHRHRVQLPGDAAAVWVWDKAQGMPVARTMRQREAEEYFAQRLARQALELQPQDADARTLAVSVALQSALDRAGLHELPAKEKAVYQQAVSAGPAVMTAVLRHALADGKDELAATAAMILGKLTNLGELSGTGHPHPLVQALSAPGAHVQFAAARALVELSPTQPFAGSSRVVPTLARFLTAQRQPRAVVIDGNANRGSQLAGSLRSLGYETALETSGDQGFEAAAETGDVELVMVSHALVRGAWGLTDLLTNLKSDARTADLPVFVYGPLNLELTRPNLRASFPKVKFLVQPVNAQALASQLQRPPAKLSEAERLRYAHEAAELLARIAAQPNSTFAQDLTAIEPALAAALSLPETSLAVSKTLGNVPDADAQRSLADAALDPSNSPELRRSCVTELARSVKRFGPLVSADQEKQLAAEARTESDPEIRKGLDTAVAALRARATSGRGVRSLQRPRSPGASGSRSGQRALARPTDESP
jgi:HEAT repeat protein